MILIRTFAQFDILPDFSETNNLTLVYFYFILLSLLSLYFHIINKQYIINNHSILYIFKQLRCGEISTQIEIHLTPCHRVQHEFRVEDPELCPEDICDEVNVLLAGDHDIVDGAPTVELLHLVRCLPASVFHPGK